MSAWYVNHSYEDTFNVFEHITHDWIGEVTLMSDGWAAYPINRAGTMPLQKRMGTYPDAGAAFKALNERFTAGRRAGKAARTASR